MEFKRLSDLFWTLSPNWFFLSVVLGILSSVSYAMLIPFIMYAVTTPVAFDSGQSDYWYFESPIDELAKVFIVMLVLIVLFKGLSSVLSMTLVNRASAELRLQVYRQVSNMSLARLERVGPTRLVNVLHFDIPAITAAAVSLPQLWVTALSLCSVLGYLVYLNAKVFAFALFSLAVAVLTYQLPMFMATQFFRQAREAEDQIQQGVNSLIYGAKELKLNRVKADAFYEEALRRPEYRELSIQLKGNSWSVFAQSYAEVIAFLLVGVIVFHFRFTYSLNVNELMGLTMGLLYITGPIGLILNVMGTIRRGNIALAKLREIQVELCPERLGEAMPMPDGQGQLTVHGLSYTYGDETSHFSLENINLKFVPGQVSFIIGGNGSGKSTLGKCLSLHYFPSTGYIALDGNIVTSQNVESSRRFISQISTDYWLFDQLYSDTTILQQEKINHYLRYLELDGKVDLVGGRFSSTKLSDGQRKRLALLVTLLDDRPICIFDEWAADQDPHFKHFFYSVILQDLRQRNKVVIVITHDDRYFTYADQIVAMDSGRVAKVTCNRAANQVVSLLGR